MKKAMALLLVFIQVFTLSVFAATLTDREIQDLYNLGIMVGDENGDLRLEDSVTRAEAVKMLCVAGDYAESVLDTAPFPDVPRGHWAESWIQTAKEKEIICGDEKGYFNPESPVTNEEIVKMIVCLLGYKPMAEEFGGYPAGYTMVASQICITEELGLEPTASAIRNNVAIMIERALGTPIMVTKGAENAEDGVTHVILNGRVGIPYATIRGTRGQKWDTSREHITEYLYAFASQYPYKDGDTEKSFALYPDIVYTSGLEETQEGVTYECPAFYDDAMAYEQVQAIVRMPATLEIKQQKYDIDYIMYNKTILVPYTILESLGCKVYFDGRTYVTTVEKDDTVLEILPNVIGMRKNQAEGYWVPLTACARFVNDELFVPLEAVCSEFGFGVECDAGRQSLIIK